jgi:hypothetical protein
LINHFVKQKVSELTEKKIRNVREFNSANNGGNVAQGKQPEVLFWVGCAGSFDDRAKNNKSICTNLNRANVPLQY